MVLWPSQFLSIVPVQSSAWLESAGIAVVTVVAASRPVGATGSPVLGSVQDKRQVNCSESRDHPHRHPDSTARCPQHRCHVLIAIVVHIAADLCGVGANQGGTVIAVIRLLRHQPAQNRPQQSD